MIPRRAAVLLLRELRERLAPGTKTGAAYDEAVARMLKESVLVLRGSENVEQKARRYLEEGRLTIERVDPQTGLVVASVRGETGTHRLGYDPQKREWRCTCFAGRRRRCSHLIALRLVVQQPIIRQSE